MGPKTIALLALAGIAVTALFAVSSEPSNTMEVQFREFLDTYRVGYGTTDEYSFRLGVFEANMKRAEELSILNPEAEFGVTKFSDRTPEEMQAMMSYIPLSNESEVELYDGSLTNTKYDWKYLWTSVKNQAACGSCWAFAAVGAFEARYAYAGRPFRDYTLYSEQQLVDCDQKSKGCGGGRMDWAYQYMAQKGLCTQAQYAYSAKRGSCADTKCAQGPKVKGHKVPQRGSETELLKELANGPVAIAVDASNWHLYKSGVFTNCATGLNHGVILAGFDGINTVTIRNSWGASWGENGYIRLKTGNTCGYANDAVAPTV